MSHRQLGRRSGFTLVELLVVIAIIGILVGMLLPAVQQVREAARRATCQNNIKNIMLACLNYQSSRQRFPSGAKPIKLGSQLSSIHSQSFLVSILSELEQQAAYDQILDNTTGLVDDATVLSNLKTVGTVFELSILKCASASQSDAFANDADYGGPTSHYVGSAGPGMDTATTGDLNYFTFSEAADATVNANNRKRIGLQGVFSPFTPDKQTSASIASPIYSSKRGITGADIVDGSSNTIAIGEMSQSEKSSTSANISNLVPHRTGWYFGGVGTNNSRNDFIPTTTFNVKSASLRINEKKNFLEDYETDVLFTNSHAFGSNHSGAAQFGFADGHVEFVADEIDAQTLRARVSTSGREVITE